MADSRIVLMTRGLRSLVTEWRIKPRRPGRGNSNWMLEVSSPLSMGSRGRETTMTALVSRFRVVIKETCKSERVIGYPSFSWNQGAPMRGISLRSEEPGLKAEQAGHGPAIISEGESRRCYWE